MDKFDTGSILSDNTFKKVQTMHSILKPFMLRRIKADVEKGLPRLKEYVLTAPLTKRQAELYGAVLELVLVPFFFLRVSISFRSKN